MHARARVSSWGVRADYADHADHADHTDRADHTDHADHASARGEPARPWRTSLPRSQVGAETR